MRFARQKWRSRYFRGLSHPRVGPIATHLCDCWYCHSSSGYRQQPDLRDFFLNCTEPWATHTCTRGARWPCRSPASLVLEAVRERRDPSLPSQVPAIIAWAPLLYIYLSSQLMSLLTLDLSPDAGMARLYRLLNQNCVKFNHSPKFLILYLLFWVNPEQYTMYTLWITLRELLEFEAIGAVGDSLIMAEKAKVRKHITSLKLEWGKRVQPKQRACNISNWIKYIICHL